MEIGGSINDFEYIVDITKLTGNDADDLIICGAISDASEDLDGETVDQSSLQKAWNQYLKNPVIRLMHDSKLGAIGRVIPEYTDSDGVIHKTGIFKGVPFIVAKISNAADLDSVRTKIREGIFSGLSIGGKGRSVNKNGRTTLFIKSLFEVSVVDVPSNKNSLFSVVKMACVGENCKINKKSKITEDLNMEQEILDIIEKKFSDMNESQKYTDLTEKYAILEKNYSDLKATKTEPEGEVKTEQVEKSLAEQVTELKAEIESMKTTPVQKSVQDGDAVIEKSADAPIDRIMQTFYGGN